MGWDRSSNLLVLASYRCKVGDSAPWEALLSSQMWRLHSVRFPAREMVRSKYHWSQPWNFASSASSFGSTSIKQSIFSMWNDSTINRFGMLSILLVSIRQFSWFGMKRLLLLVGRLLWRSTIGGFDSDSKGLERKKEFDNPLQEEGDGQYSEQLCKLKSRTYSDRMHTSKLTNQFFCSSWIP